MKNKIIDFIIGLILGYAVFIYSPIFVYLFSPTIQGLLIIFLPVLIISFYVITRIFKSNKVINRISNILFWTVLIFAFFRFWLFAYLGSN